MIFLDKLKVLVWVNEDIFSNVPMIPITGDEAERIFVVAFLAMIETYVEDWERVASVSTIG